MVNSFKYIFLIFFITGIVHQCKTNSNKEINFDKIKFLLNKKWAGSPDYLNSSQKEYFYFVGVGRASEKSLDRNNLELIKESCIRNAGYFKDEAISLSLYMSNMFIHYDSKSCPGYVQEKDKIGTFKKEYKEKYVNYFLSNTNLWKCNSLAKSRESEYKECECIFYFHLKGGRINAEKNFYRILCDYTDEDLCKKRKICD